MPRSAPCSFRSTEECALHFWFRTQKVRHLHLRQEHQAFEPPLFRGNAKSPDFLLQLRPVGVVGVEAMSSQTKGSDDRCALPTREIVESSRFERATGIPVWYAVPSPDGERSAWSWISLRQVVAEVLEMEGESTLVSMNHFLRIATGSDLGKLHRTLFQNLKPTETVTEDLAAALDDGSTSFRGTPS